MQKKMILIVGLGLSIVNLLFMHYYFMYANIFYCIENMFAFTHLLNIFSIFSDVTIIFLLMYLLTLGRIRTSIHLCFFTTLIWSFANVLYSRFFYQNISLSAIFQIGNITDGIVTNSMVNGFRWTDFFYFISATLYIVAYKRYSIVTEIHKGWRKNKKLIITIFSIPFISFTLSFLSITVHFLFSPNSRNHPELYFPRLNEYLTNPFIWKSNMPVNVHYITGSVRYIISDIVDELTVYELTDEERKEIRKEYIDYHERRTEHNVNPKIKNVIFILLESFLSTSSDLQIEGKEITPFLNSLKKDSSIYYNGNIEPNITIGESGDGQLIYMSGLLPLKNKITVGIAKKHELIGLPQLLKEKFGIKYTEIIIPSSPVVWEQRSMNMRYGIDYMLSAVDIAGSSSLINDEMVYSLAKRTNKESKQPFFSMVLGISTHQPYNNSVDKDFCLSDTSMPIQYKNYLIACHYVDKQIKKYFDYLRKKNIFENSLIIIASDHHPHIEKMSMEGKISKTLPLYIINSGLDVENMYHGKANQLDVYTTILDILGINSEWQGLGHTLLSPNYTNSVDNKTYDISEKIIMGNYFSNN